MVDRSSCRLFGCSASWEDDLSKAIQFLRILLLPNGTAPIDNFKVAIHLLQRFFPSDGADKEMSGEYTRPSLTINFTDVGKCVEDSAGYGEGRLDVGS